jgi:very-short-patch-repair endonuclease
MEFKCEICGFIAKRKEGLTSHKKTCLKKIQEREQIYFCKKCGKEYILKDGCGKNYCSISCRNSHHLTQDQRNHIKKGIENFLSRTLGTKEERLKNKEEKKLQQQKDCPVCKKRKISIKTEMCSGCRAKTPERRERARQTLLRRIKEYQELGIRFGQYPYSEKFWKGVFINRNIKFKEQFIVKPYILDFLIEKNGKLIDFEVDGIGIHRKKIDKDEIRNKYLQEKNYLVFRTWWNGNKMIYLNKEIERFEKFYNEL